MCPVYDMSVVIRGRFLRPRWEITGNNYSPQGKKQPGLLDRNKLDQSRECEDAMETKDDSAFSIWVSVVFAWCLQVSIWL